MWSRTRITQYLSGRVRASVATMFILPTEETLTSNHRPGAVCRRKVHWRSSSPLRGSPPLTGPRTAMPFDRHTVPGLLLYVDIERRLEVPAGTSGRRQYESSFFIYSIRDIVGIGLASFEGSPAMRETHFAFGLSNHLSFTWYSEQHLCRTTNSSVGCSKVTVNSTIF